MRDLQAALERELGVRVEHLRAVTGGDINDSYLAVLGGGDRVFVKTSRHALPGMYASERRGLDWLREAEALRIPECLACADDVGSPRFLALEWIEPGHRRPDFEPRLGRGLAHLHQAGAAGFGLDHDNFIGPLPQSNEAAPTWPIFYGERRLRPQLRRACDGAAVDGALRARLEQLIDRLADVSGPPEPAARLHGDLWSGNVHTDERGRPCLIDPAVYGGHREIDLAMLQLFGSPGEAFFSAYEEVWPLAAGWRERVPLYQVYPLLVHVNLFGSSYLPMLAERVDRIPL